MKVVLLDTGIGNMHSLAKALDRVGASVTVSEDPAAALAGDALVLPGVGAFPAAAERLAPSIERLREAIRDGFPCLGICLGMQLLFDTSEEGPGSGLGLLPGRIRSLRGGRIPHIGWNLVGAGDSDPLTAAVGEEAVYYAHSYVADPEREASVLAWTEHPGGRFPAVVRTGRCWGVQFHPEKSGPAGLRLLEAWISEVAR